MRHQPFCGISVRLLANSVDPDQAPAASYLDLHCLHMFNKKNDSLYGLSSFPLTILYRFNGLCILRKTIEGYLDSILSLTAKTIKILLIMHAFHSSRHLQSK